MGRVLSFQLLPAKTAVPAPGTAVFYILIVSFNNVAHLHKIH
jgi:hypothetical protein